MIKILLILSLLNLQENDIVFDAGSTKIFPLTNEVVTIPEKGPFDVAISLLSPLPQKALLKKITSHLKPQGRALIIVSPAESMEQRALLALKKTEKWKNKLHLVSPLYIDEIKNFLTQTGMKILYSEVHHEVKTFHSSQKLKQWVLKEVAPLYEIDLEDYPCFASDFVEKLPDKTYLIQKQLVLYFMGQE